MGWGLSCFWAWLCGLSHLLAETRSENPSHGFVLLIAPLRYSNIGLQGSDEDYSQCPVFPLGGCDEPRMQVRRQVEIDSMKCH